MYPFKKREIKYLVTRKLINFAKIHESLLKRANDKYFC